MFMQLWSLTVIHLSLSKTYRLKKLDPQQQMYPQKNLLECFSRWLNQPSHASLSLLRSNWTFKTRPQKTRCDSCKQTIYHSTTTVPSSEIPTFDGIADQLANHGCSNNHAIDFDNALIIDKFTFRTGKTLEAWQTRVTPNADNNSCPLPGHYNIIFNKHS